MEILRLGMGWLFSLLLSFLCIGHAVQAGPGLPSANTLLKPIRMATARVRIFKKVGPVTLNNIGPANSFVEDACTFTSDIGVYQGNVGIPGGVLPMPLCKTELNHALVVIQPMAAIWLTENKTAKYKTFQASFTAFDQATGMRDDHSGNISISTQDLSLRNLSSRIVDEARILPHGYLGEEALFLEANIEFNDGK